MIKWSEPVTQFFNFEGGYTYLYVYNIKNQKYFNLVLSSDDVIAPKNFDQDYIIKIRRLNKKW